MRQFVIAFIGLAIASTTAAADTVGVWVGASHWNYDISGSARYKSNNSADDVDLDRDLGYDNASTSVLYVALEHPVPVLPNIRITHTDLDEDANGRLSKSVTYGDTTFLVNEAVNSRLELKQTDVTLYYSVLDNLVDLDLGLTAKYIDSSVRITGETSGTEDASLSAWIPMAYAALGADLPLTGLAVGAEVSAIAYQDSRFYDFTVRATYQTPWLIGLNLGYRRIGLDLDDIDDSFADIKFSGPYLGAYLHF